MEDAFKVVIPGHQRLKDPNALLIHRSCSWIEEHIRFGSATSRVVRTSHQTLPYASLSIRVASLLHSICPFLELFLVSICAWQHTGCRLVHTMEFNDHHSM